MCSNRCKSAQISVQYISIISPRKIRNCSLIYYFFFVVCKMCFPTKPLQVIIIIIIVIGTTASFEPMPSSEASASCPCSFQLSSNFSPATYWHLPSRHLPILVSAYPSVFFLLPLQRELFLEDSVPPYE